MFARRQDLIASTSHTTKEKTWHATGKCTEPGKMQHLVDGRAWKNFDTNMWPVIPTKYNLPLWLCMKVTSFMTTLLIPGPKSPGKDIDVYLRPLIDDLKDLWAKPGKTTYVGYKRFLKKPYKWMRSLDFNGEIEDEDPPRKFNRDDIMAQLARLPTRVKAQSKVADILRNLKLIYPSGFFDIMIHLVIHLPLEALEGEPIHPWWISVCKLIGLRSVIHIDHQELKKVIWCVLRNNPEIDTYRVMLKSQFPNKDTKEEFLGWFGSQIHQCHVDKDLGVSASSDLFALACEPALTPISVNSCVVNGVRFVVYNHDKRHTTQNSIICLPGDDGEMYYGQLKEILEFSLNDLEIAALHIDGQSIDVDAPPDIIDVDEDDDIIDDEEVLLYDLADFDDEDVFNVDDDDGVAVVYSSEEED
nr:hypothetical protein [Tanacetum cinerariifolium]